MSGHKKAYLAIAVVSIAVLIFLFWLIYFKEAADSSSLSWVGFLPTVNASLNSLTTFLLIAGYLKIKNGQKEAHIKCMLSAVGTSGLFLISYIVYHHYQGDTLFLTTGILRPIYFFILISHIVLSVVLVPMIFVTLYHAFLKHFETHKKIARITFPIWLYVSVTGVLVYIFVHFLNFPPA